MLLGVTLSLAALIIRDHFILEWKSMLKIVGSTLKRVIQNNALECRWNPLHNEVIPKMRTKRVDFSSSALLREYFVTFLCSIYVCICRKPLDSLQTIIQTFPFWISYFLSKECNPHLIYCLKDDKLWFDFPAW